MEVEVCFVQSDDKGGGALTNTVPLWICRVAEWGIVV
jgi:hypothetical protein